MTDSSQPDTEELVRQAASGDREAGERLLVRHRDRLKRMVGIRMDPRLASRVDPSDVVQETLVRAAERLSEYLRDRALPFYPWIRQLALEQIVRQHRQHITAGVRSLDREAPHSIPLPDHSAISFSRTLAYAASSPSS